MREQTINDRATALIERQKRHGFVGEGPIVSLLLELVEHVGVLEARLKEIEPSLDGPG